MSNSTNINISCGLMPDIAAIKVRSGVIFFLIKCFCKVYQKILKKKHVLWLVLILFVQQYVGQWVVLILLSYYLATVQIHGNCKIINNSASHCLACASLGYSSNLKNCIYKTFHETFLGVEVLDLWNSYSCSRSFRICWKLSKHICFVQKVSLSFTFHFFTLCSTILKVDRCKSNL